MPSRSEILSFDDAPEPPGANPFVVEPERVAIKLVEYNPQWPLHASEYADRLHEALGTRALRIEHVGSTSVPGLAAKPIIDIDLTVANSSDENGWLPRLQASGFELTVREPWWHEHRMLRGTPGTGRGPAANVHVFGPESPELFKHIVFRNWLRVSDADRELYAEAKREAAAGEAQRVTDYNVRKQDVIREIYQRAFSAAGFDSRE